MGTILVKEKSVVVPGEELAEGKLLAVLLLVAVHLWSVVFRLCSAVVVSLCLLVASKGKKSCKYLNTWDRLTIS